MVKWKDLKLSERWSSRKRFNFIMDYIDTTLGVDNGDEIVDEIVDENTDNPTVNDTVEQGTVNVSVTDGENGVSSVVVTLSNGTDEYTGTTGKAGGCTIRDVPYGDYDVSAVVDGYLTYDGDLTVDNENVDLNITLEAE